MNIKAFSIPANKIVNCIIPMRLGEERRDALERLEYFKLDSRLPDSVGFIVVDDGSKEDAAAKIKEACEKHGIGYIRVESTLREFSVGRCRNIGAMYARSKYVLMQDVDLMPWPGFYQTLLDEVEIQGLEADAKKFLMVPYVFLTKEGTRLFFDTPAEKRVNKLLYSAWINDPLIVEKLSTGTSANLYNRHWYLSRGGNSVDFEGWGYEDLECNTRLIRHLNFFPTPGDWLLQKFNFNTVLEYRTWKAVYRLFGDMLFYRGIAFFHAWHPVTSGGSYMQRAEYNRVLFEKKMKSFVAHKAEPDPLPDLSQGKSLLIRRNAFTFARDIQPLLGEVVEPDEQLMSGEVDLYEFMVKNAVDRVVFHNPFLDEQVLALYRKAKAANLAFVVCERGALPGSCFFDSTGFLVDGTTYLPQNWDRSLSDEFREKTLHYIKTLHNGDESLERQDTRSGGDAARKRLGLKPREKVLLVVFQRPGDTVTRFFTDRMGGYSEFVNFVRDLSCRMPVGWKLVAKRHPLEEIDFELNEKSVYANNVNIRDLLDIADAVLTFNSGVGVMAMAWGVPTMLAGDAFYQHEKLNHKVATVDQALCFLRCPLEPDSETVLRFYSYLINEVYSFGTFSTKAVKMPDGSNMTATTNIEFEEIRWPGLSVIRLSNNRTAKVSWRSYLFDRYRREQGSQRPVAIDDGIGLAPLAGGSKIGNRLNGAEGAAAVKNGFRAKWIKFRKSPRRFFSDSRYRPLRVIGRLIS